MIKKVVLFLVLISELFSCSGMGPERLERGVTHGIPLGRMGDFLLWYIKAKYVSDKYKLPFLLNVPYQHLEDIKKLKLYTQEEHLDKHLYIINYIKNIKTEDELPGQPFRVVAPDFACDHWSTIDGIEDVTGWPDIMQNTRFRNILRDMICLVDPIDEQLLPSSHAISIAVHIRTGNNWDTDGNRAHWYYKFPAMEFYITALKKIISIFNEYPLQVMVFTDDPDPMHLVRILMHHTGTLSINYRCRKVGNHPNRSVLEDLEAMKQYDCLIRGMSGFAQVAHLLGNYKIVIYPRKFEERNVVEMTMLTKQNYKQLLLEEKNLV